MDLVINWLIAMLVALVLLFVIIRIFRYKRGSRQASLVKNPADKLQLQPEEERQQVSEDVEVNEVACSVDSQTNTEEKLPSLPISKEIVAHCIRFFAAEPKVFGEERGGVAIALFPPTRKRGWWTYVTAGLHQELQAEMIVYSYKEEEEIVEHLSQLARDCRERAMIVPRTAIPLAGPIIKGSSLGYALLTPPIFESEGFEYFTNGTDLVRMIMLHPIAAAEADFLATNGFSALEELFIQQEVDSLDFFRRSATEKGGDGL